MKDVQRKREAVTEKVFEREKVWEIGRGREMERNG